MSMPHACHCRTCGREMSPMFVTGLSNGTQEPDIKAWPCWFHREPTKGCESCYQAFVKLFEGHQPTAKSSGISEMTEKYILCVLCRGTFSDADVDGHIGCPRCGSTSVPADTRKIGQVTLTNHEWRILTIWAMNWAEQCDRNQPSGTSRQCATAIINEIRRQAPSLKNLTFTEELQEVANAYGRVEMQRDGETTVFEPVKKS